MPYKNPEHQRINYAKWAKDNPTKVNRRRLKWRKNNLKKHRAQTAEAVKRWRKKFPEKDKSHKHLYRARLLGSYGKFTAAQWDKLKHNNLCLCCRKKRKLTPDHVVPLSRGGSNKIQNIQPLCGPCNSRKGVKTTDYRN
jgi:5-methylcytosine-specific restriction endonuclease McrA